MAAALQAQTASSCNGSGAADGGVGGGSFISFPWPALPGFLLLTLNSTAAAVRAHRRGDAAAVAFVGFSYTDVVALLVCLRMYERARAGSPTSERLRIAVWVLTSLLTLAFSSEVVAIMPAPAAALVWLVALATVAGGFVALYVCKEDEEVGQANKTAQHALEASCKNTLCL